MILGLKPSRLLRAWWCALHALLAAAILLAGMPMALKAILLAALVGHGAVRRPRPGPTVIHVAADGSCDVPEWRTGNLSLGAGTLVCPFWIKLDLGRGIRQRYIFLFADQVGPDDWRRLRALLALRGSE